jgi:hypothetical protein
MENHAAVVVHLDLSAAYSTTALERSKAETIQPQAIDELYKRFGLGKNENDS